MGLDITHYKFTPIKTDSSRIFLKEEIESVMMDENNLLKEIYSELLVDGWWNLGAVFNNKKELKLSKSELRNLKDGYTNYKLVIAKTEENYEEKIRAFERDNRLKELEKTQYEDIVELKNGQEIEFESLGYYGTLKYYKAAYFEEVGHQFGGGMNKREFYAYFENDSYYSEFETFKKLLDFTRRDMYYDNINVENNFIKNYEKGKSILEISW